MPFAWICRRCRGPKPPLKGGPLEKPWVGPCPSCGGLYDGERVSVGEEDGVDGAEAQPVIEGEVISLEDAVAHASSDPEMRFTATGWAGTDWVLNGGIPPGVEILLSAPAGAGKSTLLIELFRQLAKLGHRCLYICSEESTRQMGGRYGRLGSFPKRLQVVAEREFPKITELLRRRRPKFAAVDSLHDLKEVEDSNGFVFSTGSDEAIELAAKELKIIAEEEPIMSIFVVAHVTKAGVIAGSGGLRHSTDLKLYLNGRQKMIDGELQIVGEERSLRCDGKNRFGETGRRAYMRLDSAGLRDMGPWHHTLPPWEASVGNRVTENPSDG